MQHTDTSENTKATLVRCLLAFASGCHMQHIDTSKNTEAWDVSQHNDTSKKAKTWAVSLHNDTSKKVALKCCYALHSQEGD